MMDPEVIRESLTCPITGDIMTDPVQGNDGQTYERSAIMQALDIKQESPITRAPMTVADLKVNAAIRYLLDKYNAAASNVSSQLTPTSVVNTTSIYHPTIGSMVMKDGTKTLFTFDVKSKSMTNTNTDTNMDTTKLDVGTDLVLAIDRSGSMQIDVEAKNNSGKSIENGFSQQDMVNHAAKTVAKSLGPNDRLTVIIFDNQNEIIFNLTPMTELNCTRALSQIANIKPRGQTDIWRAIDTAYNILNERTDKSRNPAIIILTDGWPNISPSRGEVYALNAKRKKLDFYPPLYTFGFGYNLQPELLYGLAKEGDGAMGHIPDGGMIATVFSNFLANIRCTVAYNMKLEIQYEPTTDKPVVPGDFKYEVNGNSITINLGTVQIGQSRNILLNNVKPVGYTYTYNIGDTSYSDSGKIASVTHANTASLFSTTEARFYLVEQLRNMVIMKSNGKSTAQLYLDLTQYFESKKTNSVCIQKMEMTLLDQIRLAVSEAVEHTTFHNGERVSYFMKWGRWYLDQITRALNQQWKPNFKDEACDFGGELFQTLVDHTSDQFDSLPAPTPSNINNLSGTQFLATRTPVKMSAYNSSNNPCFLGSSVIKLSGGGAKLVKYLHKGDKVLTLSDPYDIMSTQVEASVVCVLKTIMPGIAPLVTLGTGLKITPWHPVLCGMDWQFPNQMGMVINEPCDAVYSILLDSGHTCMINDIWCIGLGHSYDHGILKHDYFGSSAIVEDMKSLPDWDRGLVVIDSMYSIIRDAITTQIVSIRGKGKMDDRSKDLSDPICVTVIGTPVPPYV